MVKYFLSYVANRQPHRYTDAQSDYRIPTAGFKDINGLTKGYSNPASSLMFIIMLLDFKRLFAKWMEQDMYNQWFPLETTIMISLHCHTVLFKSGDRKILFNISDILPCPRTPDRPVWHSLRTAGQGLHSSTPRCPVRSAVDPSGTE